MIEVTTRRWRSESCDEIFWRHLMGLLDTIFDVIPTPAVLDKIEKFGVLPSEAEDNTVTVTWREEPSTDDLEWLETAINTQGYQMISKRGF